MIRRGIIPFFVLFALSISVSSCLEDIDLDTGERILNVYCVLRNGPEQELELSYIAPVGGTSRPVGESVTISLYDGDALVGQFIKTSDTKWKMDYTPEGGHTYRLEVRVPGEEMLTAETRYPCAGTLRDYVAVWGNYESMQGGYISYGGVGFKMDAPEDQILWCYYENTLVGPAFADFIATDHPGADGRGETIYPFDASSPIFKNETEPGGFCLAGSVFTHLFSDEPPLLHKKALRILHPVDFNRPLGEKELRVFDVSDPSSPTQEYLPTQEFVKTSLFGIGGVNKTAMLAQLVIESVSAEYDNYLSDFYYGQQDTGDFTALVYKRNHYTNIMHGIGIFGASYTYRYGTYHFSHRLDF